jgi:hypothetical protein
VFARQGHELLQSVIARERLVHARQQLRELRQRRHDAPGQHRAGDDGAGADLSLLHKEKSQGHDADPHKLPREIGDIAGELAEHAGLQADGGLM